MDNSNTDSSAVCTGHVRLARHVHRRQRRALRGREGQASGSSTSPPRSSRSRRTTSRSSTARCMAKGAPDRKISVAGRRGRRDVRLRRAHHRQRARRSSRSPRSTTTTARSTAEPHSAISYAACVIDVEVDDETGETTVLKMLQVYDVGRAINPTLVEGQIEGGAMMGLGLGLLENCYPYYPSVEHRGEQFGSYLAPALEDFPEIENVILENPSVDGPFGAKAIGEMANNAQPPAIAAAIHDAVGVWVTEMPATPERVLARPGGQARAAPRGQARDLRRGDLRRRRSAPTAARRTGASMPESVGFSTWNGVESYEFVDGVRHPRDRRRPGAPVPGRLPAGQDRPAPRPRAHRAAHGGRRGLGAR